MTSKSGKMVWTDSTQSGLGDRILNTFFILVVARKLGASLYLNWKPYHAPSGDVPNYRKQDILLENLKTCLILPSDLHIMGDVNSLPVDLDYIYTKYSGYTQPSDFYEECGMCELFDHPTDFENAVANALSEIRFSDEMLGVAKKMIPDVSVHVRRTDKVRSVTEKDPHMISIEELDDLNCRTWKWIENLSKEHKTFYVCGDDPAAVDTYNRRIAEMGLTVFVPDLMSEDWRRTFLDLAVMSSSKIILQSQKNSSFSKVASMIGGNRLINVYKDA